MYAIWVDWSEEFQKDTWEFVGHHSYTEEELEEDYERGMPMMNYAYPLYYFDGDGERIKKICNETNCTVVYNQNEDKYYLALTGGGMDLSQDIALAYLIASGDNANPENGYIEWDIINEIYISGPLSVGEKEYKLILKHLLRQSRIERDNANERARRIRKKLKKYKNNGGK